MKRVWGVRPTAKSPEREDGPASGGSDPGLDGGFDGLFQREFSSMVAVAYATSGNRMAAEDIVQEAFLAAYRDWDRVGGLDNPATWVRRVVINKSVSSVRSHLARLRAVARLGSPGSTELPPVSAETDHLWTEVRRLPRRQRQVVALRFVGQLTLVEIGDVLGCSKETVSTHLRRAAATLAERVPAEEHR